eukprot:4722088-Pyramimonas_sp.AAC.1
MAPHRRCIGDRSPIFSIPTSPLHRTHRPSKLGQGRRARLESLLRIRPRRSGGGSKLKMEKQ